MYIEIESKIVLDPAKLVYILKENDVWHLKMYCKESIAITEDECLWITKIFGRLIVIDDFTIVNMDYVTVVTPNGEGYKISLMGGYQIQVSSEKGLCFMKDFLFTTNLAEKIQSIQQSPNKDPEPNELG